MPSSKVEGKYTLYSATRNTQQGIKPCGYTFILPVTESLSAIADNWVCLFFGDQQILENLYTSDFK